MEDKSKLTNEQLVQTYQEINNLEEYKKTIIETNLEDIDEFTGGMRKGQLWTVGGLSGVGKSYFILNMINRITQKRPLNICIFAVEMDTQEYFKRLACMRAGIYKKTLLENIKKYELAIKKEIDKLMQEYPEQDRIFEVHGNIASIEQVEKILGNRQIDLIIIDYVQMLSVGTKQDEKDTMPILASRLRKLPSKHNACVVAVSQLNNYANQLDTSKSQAQPYSFGKQLIQASDVAMMVMRKKRDGKLDNNILVNVTKSRDGVQGTTAFEIGDGYNLRNLHPTNKMMVIADYYNAK